MSVYEWRFYANGKYHNYKSLGAAVAEAKMLGATRVQYVIWSDGWHVIEEQVV